MNRFEQAASFDSAMGKLAGLFWKKLDKPVGIKAIWGNEDDPADSHDPVDFDRPTVHARLGAYRTMEPRLLTRLFSSPSKDYKNMLAGMQSVVDRDPDPGKGGVGLESPIGRAIWASDFLPLMLADRYSYGTDAPLGNEDVFEDTRTPYYKGLQGHMKSHGMPFPEDWKQITHPEILNPKLKGGGIKIEDIKMGKSAGLFWKKLDKPVGIKSLFGPDDGATSMRLDAERTMSPRLLTRLFSSPRKDYDHMFSAIKLNEEYGEDRDSPANQALATPEGRAMLASYMLPRWYPDRYKQEGDSPIGGEDIFENAVYRAKPGLKKAAAFGPSWFPFRTQGMIDKARDAEYLRSDNEEEWDANDWKKEMALRDDHTREGVNNILNHYLDRNYGVVKNPYRKPEDIKDYPPNYTDMVDKNLPWKMNTEPDVVHSLFEQSTFPEYNDPTNRQKLFDEYYPYLDLAPSAKPSKKGTIAKAAAFGAMMGKMAAGEAPVAPQPSARDIQIHNARMELQRKGQMVRDAAGGNGAYGTSRGTMKDGVIQPGATFTRQEGQQSQRPLPGAGGQINTPPVPRGMQPVPPASSPVIESKTPRRLF